MTPESGFEDALNEILCGKSVRCGPLPLDQVGTLDEKHTFDIYRDRFADFSDFTFTFVGNFDLDTLKTLAQTYLGNLPSTGRKETWRDIRAELPTAVVEKTVHKGLDERARTRIVFTGPISPTLENEVMLDVLENVLDIRVVDELRQTLGGDLLAAGRHALGDAAEADLPRHRRLRVRSEACGRAHAGGVRRCSKTSERRGRRRPTCSRPKSRRGSRTRRRWRRTPSGSRSLRIT